MTHTSSKPSSIRSLSDYVSLSTNALPKDQRIAFVQAGWHHEIVEQSLFSFSNTLSEQGIDQSLIDVFDVAGSLEIPLQCKLLAQSGNYTLIVAAGLIVDGGVYRHDFVATTVLDAMMKIQLETLVPILSLVLTPHHFSGEKVHQDFFFEHFKYKGEEAAQACLKTLNNLSKLKLIA